MEDGRKIRSATTGSSSSIQEYVNEVFTASELELSKGVSISVSDEKSAGKEGAGNQNLHSVIDFTHSDEHGGSGANLLARIKSIRKMYVAAFVVLTFALNMGLAVTYTATATMDMKKFHSSLHPTEDEITWIASLLAVGALLGGSAAGYFTGAFGRKGTLVLNTAPFVFGWLLIAHANSVGLVYFGRIMTGFSSGIISVATPMYLVEISTPDVRGLLGASFQLFVVIGVLIVSALGSVLTWRYLAISGAVMTLLSGFIMISMPESPRWLMTEKKPGEAKNAIKFLQSKEFDAEAECNQMEGDIAAQPKGSITLNEFKEPTAHKPFIFSILLMFFQQFSGVNAVLFYTVQIFESAGSTMNSVLATILVAIVQVIATLVSSLLMDRAGRKPLLLCSGAVMALSLIIFGGFDFAKSKDPSITLHYGWLPLACLMAFIAAFSIGFGPTPWLMVAEMTPARLRSFVSGIATALNWTFAFMITKLYKMEEETIKGYGIYWMYGSICIGSLFFTFFFLPETKGKSMEEIQEFFERKDSVQKKE